MIKTRLNEKTANCLKEILPILVEAFIAIIVSGQNVVTITGLVTSGEDKRLPKTRVPV